MVPLHTLLYYYEPHWITFEFNLNRVRDNTEIRDGSMNFKMVALVELAEMTDLMLRLVQFKSLLFCFNQNVGKITSN